MTVPEAIAGSRHVRLTTFRRDGTAVPTPVWYALDGDALVVVSEAAAGKVKRIRNDGRVVVTACDFRGRVAEGAATAEGTARLLDEAGTRHARDLLARRYVTSRVGNWFARVLRVRRAPLVGIAVTFPAGAAPAG